MMNNFLNVKRQSRLSINIFLLFNIFLILFAIFPIKGNAQKVSDFIFEKYSIQSGLSMTENECIYEDKLGYIWIGSQMGIDRFDGYGFKNYSNDINNKFSKSSGWTLDITEDEKGDIWTSDTYGYISILNKKNDHWVNINLKDLIFKNNQNKSLVVRGLSILVDDKNHCLWVGSDQAGLIKYDLLSKVTKLYSLPTTNANKFGYHQKINKVLKLNGYNLLLSTEFGLQVFNINNHTYTPLNNSKDSIYATLANDVKLINNKIYSATDYGAYIYSINSKAIEKIFKFDPKNKNTIASNTVNKIHYSVSTNNLWLTIENKGIDVINLNNNKVINLNYLNAKKYGLDLKNYTHILEDKGNNIWILGDEDVIKYDPNKIKFSFLGKDFPDNFNLGFSAVWGTFIDSKGHLWLGQYIEGSIMEIDRSNNIKKEYPIGNSIKTPWIIAEDSKGNIFAFNMFPRKTNGITIYKKLRNSANFISLGILKDENNEIYNSESRSVVVSGNRPKLNIPFLNNKGELILSIPGEKTMIVLSNSDGESTFQRLKLPKNLESGFTFVIRKSKNEMYIQNSDGIFLLDENKNIAKPLTTNISFLLEDFIHGFEIFNDRYAYLASYGKGLIVVDFKENTKKYLTQSEGIPSTYLYDIFKDNDNKLWISSNYGIIRYNPQTNTFRSFGPSEGAQYYEFNSYSASKLKTGEIFFGGMKGINFFYPDSIKDQSNPPSVIIQKFSTNDTNYHVESKNLPEEFVLNYNNNNLSFDFIAFNYRDNEKNQYAYKLEGYNEDWISAGLRRYASYTNLREGTYIFRVKAANNDGIWNEEGAKMVIHILPPPWRTWWAYLFYVILISCSAYFFLKYREKKQFKKLEDQRKNGELAEAKALQERLLPKTLPVIKNLDIAAFLRTSTEVGGDYYDFFVESDGSLYAICGDATGHGTASGMLVSITKAGLIGLPQLSPKDVLHELNRVIKKVDLGTLRMSLNIALVKDNQITLSSAAMPPYYLYRAATKTAEEIQLSGVPLGSFKDIQFDQTTTAFNTGDILVIISDGLPEAPNLAGELFDYQKLQGLITNYGNLTAQEVIDQLMIEADNWLAGNHNPDDITIVVIKHK
jgi:ligand-binding sensor domain-containing protein